MLSVDARLSALADALRQRQMEAAPLDGLSQSLFDLQREFIALDSEGKAALLEELNCGGDDGTMGLDLTLQVIERVIDDWRPR